jgi:hypothetical protein
MNLWIFISLSSYIHVYRLNECGGERTVAVQEEATIDVNLEGEGTVHHGSDGPKSPLGSTVHL